MNIYNQRGLCTWLACFSLSLAAHAADKPKPAFQYQSGDIRVSIPTADEPRVKEFGPASLKLAAKYLEDGALTWVREKSCVNCHTTGPYLAGSSMCESATLSG